MVSRCLKSARLLWHTMGCMVLAHMLACKQLKLPARRRLLAGQLCNT
jgi:hypothetical protein